MEENLRQSKYVIYYEHVEKPHVDTLDVLQILSMIFGVIAFLAKFKFSIWLSLIFFVANYTDQKINVPTSKFMMNFGLIMMGFALIYIFPN